MRIAIPIALLAVLSGQAWAAGKIAYGNRAGMEVTIVSSSGLNSANATIKTKHTRSDATAYCREYVGKVTEDCVRRALETRLAESVTADCPAGTFTDFLGNRYQFKGANPKKKDAMQPKYLVVHLGSGEVADGSMASSYGLNLGIFQALCPKRAPKVID